MANKKLFSGNPMVTSPLGTKRIAIGDDSIETQNMTLSALKTWITGTTTPVTLCTKSVCIGNWNMCGTPGVSVSLGVCLCQIRSVDVIIRSDSCEMFPLIYPNDNMEFAGYWKLCCTPKTNAVIALSRKANYFFAQSAFNCTSWNRGWITLSYIP